MKKMIIAAAIVCAAAVSQAASFTWATSSKVYMPWAIGSIQEGTFDAATSGSSSKQMVGWTKAAFTATIALTVGSDTVKTEVKTISYSSGMISVAGLENSLFTLPAEGQTKDVAYSIIINGTYTDSSEQAWTITSSAITGTQTLTDKSMMQLSTGTPSQWTFAKNTPEPTPTPEPTSAILLLVGMAGLALRRRRA